MFQSIKLISKVDNKGCLQVQLPSELSNSEIEFMLVYQPIFSEPAQENWPSGFLNLYGCCADDPIIIDDLGISELMDDDLAKEFD